MECHRNSKLAGIDHQISQNKASLTEEQATSQKLSLVIPLLQERLDIFKTLFGEGWGLRPQVLELTQEVLEHQQDLAAVSAKMEETNSAIAALEEQRREAEAEFRRSNLSDLADAEQKAGSLREQLVQAQQRQRLQTLRAPVDGTVQQVAVHTIGGVVTPAQQLMVIVPADSRLEIEAMVPNRDIGFVQAGQSADIKVDTFNFTKYGLLHGEVMSVSHDAIVRDDPTDAKKPETERGSVAETSEPKGQELLYAARISLETTQMQVEGKEVSLTPGMAVTVEVKTGARRVIEYALSPLLRFEQEGLRER